jgi:hypothetical protein
MDAQPEIFETLKELAAGDMLTIDDDDAREFTEAEDYEVVAVKLYSQDEGELLLIDLNRFYLAAHSFDGEPRYYLCELNASGDEDELEDDGYRLVLRDDPMPRKLYAGRNDREIPYQATIGPIYNLNVDRDDAPPEEEAGEIAACEYRGKTKNMTHILIEKLDAIFNVYQGFQISEGNIVI